MTEPHVHLSHVERDRTRPHGYRFTLHCETTARNIYTRHRLRRLKATLEAAADAALAERGWTLDAGRSHFHTLTSDDDGILVYHVTVTDQLAATFDQPGA